MKKKRQSHNYTSELELKCLLIRIKNKKLDVGYYSEEDNRKVNKYVKWFTDINLKKYPQEEIQRKNVIKYRIKEKAILLSEKIKVNETSYEKFGSVILLMITKILTKPNFSGYTYRDEMYSDAVHKILKYLHNFNHKMISERSGQLVNSFAYISQIIHNSVIYIINYKKKELNNIKNQVSMEIVNHQLGVADYNRHNSIEHISDRDYEESRTVYDIILDYIPNNLLVELESIEVERYDKDAKIKIYIPKDYKLSLEEYDNLSGLLRTNMSIVRLDENEEIPSEEEESND